VVDQNRNSVQLFNESFSGGLEIWIGGKRVSRLTDDAENFPLYANGIECRARQYRFGGVVVQPLEAWALLDHPPHLHARAGEDAISKPKPKTEFEKRQADAPGIGVLPNGELNVVSEEEAYRRMALIEKAKASGRIEDWHAAGIPLRIRPNPPCE
jgi:hypothetical protein